MAARRCVYKPHMLMGLTWGHQRIFHWGRAHKVVPATILLGAGDEVIADDFNRAARLIWRRPHTLRGMHWDGRMACCTQLCWGRAPQLCADTQDAPGMPPHGAKVTEAVAHLWCRPHIFVGNRTAVCDRIHRVRGQLAVPAQCLLAK